MKKFLPALFASLIFTVYFIWQVYTIVENNEGKFIYPLDDTYIHLSIAKNIAVSGNYGITQYEFSSSSSSPLYTLLLALIIFIFGNSDLIPLFINYLASIFIFYFLTNVISEKYQIIQTSILVFITALFLPVCILAISGMEHVLQILINLILFKKFFEIIEGNPTQNQFLQKGKFKDNPTQTLPAREGLKTDLTRNPSPQEESLKDNLTHTLSPKVESFKDNPTQTLPASREGLKTDFIQSPSLKGKRLEIISVLKPSLLAGRVWVGLSDHQILFLFSALSTSIRYEGIFIVFLLLLISIIKKDYKLAFGLLISASIPIIIYGVFSTINGSYFFPNSVLIKSTRPKMNIYSLIMYPMSWIIKLYQNPHLLSIFVLLLINLLINFKNKIKIFNKANYEILFVLSLLIIHLTFARTGWVYRYEAYCVALGMIVLIRNINNPTQTLPTREGLKTDLTLNPSPHIEGLENSSVLKPSLLAGRVWVGFYLCIIFLLIASIPLIQRTYMSFSETQLMSQNIYQQQFQMARFLNLYYNDSKVVLNDIGACTYYTNIHLLDLNSLGSIETLKMRIKNKFDKEHIFKFANDRNFEIAILYKDSYKNYIPDEWIETAKMTIPNNIGCAFDNVVFYAVKSNAHKNLKENLARFKSKLPKSVKMVIY